MKKMKKNYLHILLVFCALTGIYSCDYISNPVEPIKVIDGGDCISTPFPTTKPFRKVLVEEYTGHKCPNCPQGAISASKLEETFHDSVIVISVHVDAFAKPASPDFPEDFRTEAGDAFKVKFSFSGYPSGLVNRKDYPATPIKAHTSWASEVNTILRTPIEADIKMMSVYNSTDSTVCVGIQTTFLTNPPVTNKYNLCLMLVQDSIIAPQLDGSTTVADYVHRHAMRDNINGIWGEEISAGSAVANDPIVKKYQFKLKKEYGYTGKVSTKGKPIACDRKKCYLVAYVYDVATYRILQAEEIKIIK